MVYIREAHPTDGRVSRANEQQGIRVTQPKTLEERGQVAVHMCETLAVDLPTVIDGLDDAVSAAYAAWPDRLYLVGKDGRIAFQGAPGPRGFDPEELRRAIVVESLGR